MPDLRVLPGRAGLLWLRHRLTVAEQGVDRLARTERDWAEYAAEADKWGLRAGMLGGRRAFRLAEPAERARVTVRWAVVMGVHYPADAEIEPPVESADVSIVASAALLHAREAYRRALEAAARHAVVTAANEILDAQVATTRQRQRALRKHRIPRLRRALDAVELALVEQERAEAVRRRWAARATTDGP